MYFKAKRDVTMTNHISGGSWYLIKKDNIYKGEYTPKMYDPNTFQHVVGLIITCEDGHSRKFDIDNFYSLEEWREIQLDSILDNLSI
jgi:hypothetical protein